MKDARFYRRTYDRRGGAVLLTVAGNFAVLADSDSDAQLDLGFSSDDDVATPRGSSLEIDGSLLFFAEATTHEAEIQIYGDSSIAVDGMLGLFGSEIDIETKISSSSLTVDGALALGIGAPDDGSAPPGDGIEIELRGSVDFLRNESKLEAAISGLVGLESTFSVGSGGSVKRTYRVSRSGAASGSAGAVDVQDSIETLISEYGPDHDYGFEY
jgi:hypothetical protein